MMPENKFNESRIHEVGRCEVCGVVIWSDEEWEEDGESGLKVCGKCYA